ncbi:MAG TPA: sugar ABC transporter substrate-binding protein [Anaerolineales bacterium]|jgi:ABC-type glycerol-3-phosphate transport system substrate-binding protein
MTKRMQRIPLVILILALAAACSPAAKPAAPTAAASTPARTATAKVIPFFTTESDPDQLAVLQQLILEYQKENPGVEVDIVLASPSSRGNRLLTALASGADLGIFEIEPTLMPQWVDAGYLLPLDDVVEAIGKDDFLPGGLFRQDGHVYAVPYAVSVYGLWLRKDLFEQAGLPLPADYNQLIEAARRLTSGNTYGIALPAGQNIATVNYFSIFLWQNGGDYFDCDGKVAFDQSNNLLALKRWAALAQFAPPGYTTWGYHEQIEAFLSGRVAMAVYGGRLGVQLYKSNPALAEKVTVIFPPFGPEKVTLGVWSRFAIAAGTKNQAEARAFLQWLVSGDRLRRYDMTLPGHMIPPLASVRAETLKDSSPYATAHADWIRSFYDWSAFTNHPAMNMGSMRAGKFQRSEIVPPWAWEVFGQPGNLDGLLQEVALGVRTPEAGWAEAVKRVNQAVASWKSAHPAWKPQGCQ